MSFHVCLFPCVSFSTCVISYSQPTHHFSLQTTFGINLKFFFSHSISSPHLTSSTISPTHPPSHSPILHFTHPSTTSPTYLPPDSPIHHLTHPSTTSPTHPPPHPPIHHLTPSISPHSLIHHLTHPSTT